MIKLNAVGIACPMPVIMTKKELDAIEEGVVEVTADNETCLINLTKFAETSGYKVDSKKEAEDRFIVTITKEKGMGPVKEENDGFDDMTIAFGSNLYGQGDPELGNILIKSFVYTVSQTEPLPKTMVFFNAGVKLTTEGSPVLEDLKTMADKGVEIISCGTCLDFYGLKEKLMVGSVSNMYTIYEAIKKPRRNIVIG